MSVGGGRFFGQLATSLAPVGGLSIGGRVNMPTPPQSDVNHAFEELMVRDHRWLRRCHTDVASTLLSESDVTNEILF